jgi:hypothetical protein
MRQIRITKISRPKNRRYDDSPLPLDARDPDIVRANRVRRERPPTGEPAGP